MHFIKKYIVHNKKLSGLRFKHFSRRTFDWKKEVPQLIKASLSNVNPHSTKIHPLSNGATLNEYALTNLAVNEVEHIRQKLFIDGNFVHRWQVLLIHGVLFFARALIQFETGYVMKCFMILSKSHIWNKHTFLLNVSCLWFYYMLNNPQINDRCKKCFTLMHTLQCIWYLFRQWYIVVKSFISYSIQTMLFSVSFRNSKK